MNGREAAGAGQAIGDRMPNLSLPLIGHAACTLDKCLAGRRGAVVVFWSSICSHCARYDEFFNTFEQRYPDIAFVAVAARRTETATELSRAAGARGLRFPILHSTDGAAAVEWFAPQTPRCYLVDTTRTLRYRGAVDNFKYPDDPQYSPYLEPAVDAFLVGRAIARPDTPSFGCAVDSVYYLLPKSM